MLSEQDNIENYENSQNEISSDTQIIHNQSLNGGRASTHIRKLSSSNRHTRSGSRGDQLLSNFSHDNSSFNNLTVLNSNSKLNKKISLISNTNCNFDKQSVQSLNQRDKFGILNQNQIRSVIYDVMMDDNSLDATSRKSKNKSSGSRSRQQQFHANQSYQDYNKSLNQYDNSMSNKQSQQNGKQQQQHHQESIGGYSNIPKSVRLSYDEIGGCHPISSSGTSPKNVQLLRHKVSQQQVLSHIDQNKTLDISRISQQNPQNAKTNTIIDDGQYQKKGALSERRHGNKDKYKEALNREVQYRMDIEQQLHSLQQEFDCFKNDVGVDQMKQVLQESQVEYQKLYDLCVQECEKSNKMHELYKKEKHLREQRENQIIDLGDQEEMLKNQIRHLEEQLNLLRDQQDTEQQSLKQTVLDQQKIIEELREVLQNEKDNCKERVFDLEEMNISLRNELQKISEKYNGSMMIEQQSTQILKNQNLDLQSQLTLLKDRINILEKQNQTLEQVFNKERQNLQNEIITLQNKLQQKQSTLIEYDQILASMREKESELVKIVDKLQNANVQSNYMTQGSNFYGNDQSQIQPQIVNQDTPKTQQQKFQKSVRNQSQNKSTNYIVKKNLGSQTQRVLEQKPITSNQQNMPQSSQQNQKQNQQQTNQSLYTSINQIKKSQINLNKSATPIQEKQTHSKSQSQIRTAQQSASARSKNTQSPGRVQRVINLTELNPKCLLNDLQNVQSHRELNTSNQQVTDPQIINQDNSISNIVTSRNTFYSNKSTINKQQYIQASQVQTQTQMRKSSRSSSPIDYLGLKPKPQNNNVFMPRLGSQNSRNKPQQNFMIQQSQTYQQQISQSNALAMNQQHLNQQQNVQQQVIPSPKIIGRYPVLENEQEDMGTPSQYSLNITPVVQSSRGQKADELQLLLQNQSNGQQEIIQNINNNNNMNSTMISATNIQLNQSMFDQEEQIQNGFISGSSSTKGTSNLSKSFDGGYQMRSASNTGLRKQVKFLLNDSKQSLNSQQLQKSNKDLPMQKQALNHQHQNSNLNKDLSPLLTSRQQALNNGMTREKEIEQLYQSLSVEMKQLKTLNNQAALQQPILQQQQQQKQTQNNSHVNLPKTLSKQSNHIVNYSFSQPQQNQEDSQNINQKQISNSNNETKMNISSCTNVSISQSNPNADNLKNKLEQIRKNKSILEDKIKEYEKKLSK